MADGDVSIELDDLELVDILDSVVPSLEEIAAINLARTDDGRGDTLGTFTTETRPTGEEVDVHRGLAAGQVADRLGSNIPDQFHDRARGAAALIGAVLVEGSTRDPREQLMKQWTDMANDLIELLATEIAAVGAGSEEGPGDDHLVPQYTFPPALPLQPYA